MKTGFRSILLSAVASIAVSGGAIASKGDDFSRGFNLESAQQFVQSEKKLKGAGLTSNRRFEAVVKAAAKVHDGLSADVATLRKQLGAGGEAINQLIPQTVSAEAQQEAKAVWNDFFSSAVTLIGGGLSDAPVAGYYNPLVDGWVVAGFKRSGDAITLTSLTTVSGAEMREQAGVALPRNTQYKSPILATYHSSANAFEKLYPPVSSKAQAVKASGKAEAYELITLRIVKMSGIVAMESKRPEVAKALRKFESAAAKGNTLEMRDLFSGNTTTPPEWLAGVSAPVRKSLKPAAMFKNENGMQVAFVSPQASRVVVLVDMKDAEFKDIIVSDYAYINGSN